jgi:hypothetical protein
MALSKMHGLGFLFVMLVVILIVNPRAIHNMYNNILGRVVLIALIILFSMNNVTLGLLVALCIIIATNMYMFEGLENMPVDATSKTTDATSKPTDATAKTTDATSKPTDATIKEKKDTVNVVTTSADDSSKDGIDKVTMESTLRAKSANSMPVNKNDFSSNEVEPSTTKEAFGSMSSRV